MSDRILFFNSQTLHAKATLPVALALADLGREVVFQVNRPTLWGRSWGFDDDYIRDHPTNVQIISPQSLALVAKLIGLEKDWARLSGRFRYVRRPKPGGWAAVAATTKNIDQLRTIKAESGVPCFAVGYEHLPLLLKIDQPFRRNDETGRETVFTTDNLFSRERSLGDILAGHGLRLTGFTHLDAVHRYLQTNRPAAGESVLVFHPGGRRGVVSRPEDSPTQCLASQKAWLDRICRPLVETGFQPLIKVHPLRARYHDLADLQPLARELEGEHSWPAGAIGFVGPDDWYWPWALTSRALLNHGSSSIYEVWAAGLGNLYICNFEGRARSGRFGFFEDIFIDGHQDYLARIKAGQLGRAGSTGLAARARRDYQTGFTGISAADAAEAIVGEI